MCLQMGPIGTVIKKVTLDHLIIICAVFRTFRLQEKFAKIVKGTIQVVDEATEVVVWHYDVLRIAAHVDYL